MIKRSEPIRSPDIQLSDLVDRGIDELPATCEACGCHWQWPWYFLPRNLTLKEAAEVSACPECEKPGINVELPGSGEA